MYSYSELRHQHGRTQDLPTWMQQWQLQLKLRHLTWRYFQYLTQYCYYLCHLYYSSIYIYGIHVDSSYNVFEYLDFLNNDLFNMSITCMHFGVHRCSLTTVINHPRWGIGRSPHTQVQCVVISTLLIWIIATYYGLIYCLFTKLWY